MNRPLLKMNRRRRGFTLIELLVVVVIIATLIALLVPAIGAAVRAARNATVQAEINTIAQALEAFKSKYGDYPPSRIILNENGYIPGGAAPLIVNSGTMNSVDITPSQLANRTQNAMRKFWPQATFSTSGAVWGPNGPWYDFNGNGVRDFTQSYILEGHECLVFFLGGIPLQANGQLSVIGFGKDPVNPFSNGIVGNGMYSANRNAPLYNFDGSRLAFTTGYTGNSSYVPANPGYLDSLGHQDSQSFYAYFSTNNGTGYDPNDINLASTNDVDSNSTALALTFCTPLGFSATSPVISISPVPNPYTTGLSVPNKASNQSPTYINAQSFQIISPGNDGAYGIGGMYAASSPGGSPELTVLQNGFSNSSDASVRNLEADNLTNFHSGKLQ